MLCCSRKVFKAILLLLSVKRMVSCLFKETVDSFATKRRQYEQLGLPKKDDSSFLTVNELQKFVRCGWDEGSNVFCKGCQILQVWAWAWE